MRVWESLLVAESGNQQPNQTKTMKITRSLVIADLDSKTTIIERADKSMTVLIIDRITGLKSFIDDMDDEARKILSSHPDTVVIA